MQQNIWYEKHTQDTRELLLSVAESERCKKVNKQIFWKKNPKKAASSMEKQGYRDQIMIPNEHEHSMKVMT